MDDWTQFTDYRGFKMTDWVIEWFWACRSWPAERKLHLLQFMTGISRVPVNGFKDPQRQRLPAPSHDREERPSQVNIVYKGLPKDDPQSLQFDQCEHRRSFSSPFTCRAESRMPCSSRPENNTRPYTIGTTFPNHTLDDDSLTTERPSTSCLLCPLYRLSRTLVT